MSIGIQRFIGTIFAIEFVLALVVHVRTFHNVDVFEYVPNLRDNARMVSFALIALFIGTVIFDRELSGPLGWIQEVPKWTVGLAIVLLVYTAWYGVEFGGSCFITRGCDQVLVLSKGLYGLNFTNQAFHADRVKVTQMITGITLLTSGFPALYFLFHKRPIYFGIPGRRG